MRGSRFHVSHFIPPAAKLWWERVEGSSSSPGPCTYRASGEMMWHARLLSPPVRSNQRSLHPLNVCFSSRA